MLSKIIREILSSKAGRSINSRGEEDGVLIDSDLAWQRGGHIVAFAAGSEGDALKSASIEILEHFAPYCSGSTLIDLRHENWRQELADAMTHPIWFAMAYFAMGENIQSANGRNIWEEYGIPFVRIYGDSPAYFPKKHSEGYLTSINAYAYEEHRSFFQRHFDSRTLSIVTPPLMLGSISDKDINADLKTRGKIIFPKNGNHTETLRSYWNDSLPKAISRYLHSASEALTAYDMLNRPFSVETVCSLAQRILGLDLTSNRRLFYFINAQLDDYVRRHKSTLVVTSLLDSPIEIWGNSWGHINFSGKRAKLIQNASYETTTHAISDALAIVDMSPNTGSAPHDRVLRSAARQTLCITNEQEFFLKNFDNSTEFSYKFSSTSIAETVDRILTDPFRAVDLGRATARKMAQLAESSAFVEKISTAVDVCALAAGSRPQGTQYFVDY